MSWDIKNGWVICIAIAGGMAAFKYHEASAFEGTDGMELECVQRYSDPSAEPHDDYSIAETERIWDRPLAPDMIPVGGVDLPGWAKVCQYDPELRGLMEGEYLDRSVRYVGRFQLRMEDGSSVPFDALDAYYASHFVSGSGLIMYPNDPSHPRVPRLIAVPVDQDGYIKK